MDTYSRTKRKHARDETKAEKNVPERQKKKEPVDLLRTRTGGAYIPPAKLKMMQEQIADKGSEQYQRMNWERLKKRIHGQINKANVSNLVGVVRELLQENIIRGKGLLARSIIQAQAFSPTFSNVYAALVAIINSKFPHIGELILRRLIVQFKRSFRRNDKATTVTVSKFIAHLINQQVAHEVLALELMILMLENPTDDSVEVTIAFLKECGAKLTELSPRGISAVFDRLRSILTDAEIDHRTQYMIEVIFYVRKDNFKAYPAVIDDLDLIDEEDQISHTITLEDAVDPENELNVFKFDPDFEKNEAMYEEIRKEIIGDPGESSDEEADEEGEEESGQVENAENDKSKTTIIDNTEQNMVAFRRNVYLTIQSSLDFQEAAHKLLKIDLKPGQDVELCHMIVDCCAQQRTYERFFGLLAERFCRLRKEFQDAFERIARDTYNTIHRFEITKLRNMARFIAHLLHADAISWDVLSEIALNEEDTTSAGRIYIKILFQELAEFMGATTLLERIRDATMQSAFDKIFPRDNPNNTRFSINFFTSIGLGFLTMDLRKHLQQIRKKKTDEIMDKAVAASSSDSDSDSSSSSSDSDSSNSSDSSDSSSDTSSTMAVKREVEESPGQKKRRRSSDEKMVTFDSSFIKQEPESPPGSPPQLNEGNSKKHMPVMKTEGNDRGALYNEIGKHRTRTSDTSEGFVWRNDRGKENERGKERRNYRQREGDERSDSKTEKYRRQASNDDSEEDYSNLRVRSTVVKAREVSKINKDNEGEERDRTKSPSGTNVRSRRGMESPASSARRGRRGRREPSESTSGAEEEWRSRHKILERSRSSSDDARRKRKDDVCHDKTRHHHRQSRKESPFH